MIYVLYHKNCMDGKGAAYAAWKKFGESAKYIEVGYGDPVPEMEGVKEIYILDFSYPKEILLEMNQTAKVVVLDHHKTAQKDLEGLDFALFDMERSGASISWDYFHPNEERKSHIDFIEDRDLWKFKYVDTKPYSLAAYSMVKDFRDFDKLDSQFLIETGEAMLSYQETLIESILQNSYITNFDNGYNNHYKVAMVNSPILQSELGNLLLSRFPEADFSWVYREDGENEYVSLRSEDNRSDVSVVAKLFGGGGHRNASGFTKSRSKND